MSDIKMCEKCKRVFSVQSEGWSAMGGTQRVRDRQTGQMRDRNAEQDQCGPCNGFPVEPGTYAIILTTSAMAELEAAQSEADMWKAKYEAERARVGFPDARDGS